MCVCLYINIHLPSNYLHSALLPKGFLRLWGRFCEQQGRGPAHGSCWKHSIPFFAGLGGAVVRLRWGNISENVSQTGTLSAGGS